MNNDIESLKALQKEYLTKANQSKAENEEEYKALLKKYHNIANKISYLKNIDTRREKNKEYMKSYLSNEEHKIKHTEYTKSNAKKNYYEYKQLKEYYKSYQIPTNPPQNTLIFV
jgi:hypothetical protein